MSDRDLDRSAARLAVDAVATMNRARETSSVSRRELASRLGVGESCVSQILHGDGNVRMATLARVTSGRLAHHGERVLSWLG